jgi:subtilisin family serine protease
MASDSSSGGLTAEETDWLQKLVADTTTIASQSLVQAVADSGSRLIVDLKSSTAALAFAEALPSVNRLGYSVVAGSMVTVSFQSAAEASRLKKAYQANPLVADATEDGALTFAASNDPFYDRLYGLHNTGQAIPNLPRGITDADIDAPEAWQITTGSPNVVVAVIDSGVDYRHPDLRNNIWVNQDEIPGNGLDDDRNGYVDDVYGYDFGDNDADPQDTNGHGTHVAGTIAAQRNNGIGIVGVAPNVKVMPLKVLKTRDGSLASFFSAAVQAIDYAVHNGAKISNNSWGTYEQYYPLETAIARAAREGHIFVAAAGNFTNNNDIKPFKPAAYEHTNIISVAATDNRDNLAYFSNYGQRSVDIAAPGMGIYSTLPGGRYGYKQGTSMAAPHVAGAAALVMSQNPSWTSEQIIRAVIDSGDAVPALAGKVASGKRLNAAQAVRFGGLTTPTLSYRNLTNSAVTLTWTDSNRETGYRIYKNGSLLKELPADSTSTVVSGLTSGTDYSFRVVAYTPGNAETATSNTISIKTPGGGGGGGGDSGLTAPTLSYRDLTTSSVTLTWTDSNKEIGYHIYKNGKILKSVPRNSIQTTITGLTTNNTYTFHIMAYTYGGAETNKSNTISVRTPGGGGGGLTTPTLSYRNLTNSSVTLTWTDSNKETGYRIYKNGSLLKELPANSTSTAVAGLTSGTSYSFKVVAYTAGNAETATSNTVSVRTPGGGGGGGGGLTKPVLSVVDVTSSSVTLTWPDSPGETSYFLYLGTTTSNRLTARTLAANTTKAVFSGLSPNTQYRFLARALTLKPGGGWDALNGDWITVTTPAGRAASVESIGGWDVIGRETTAGVDFLRVRRGETENRVIASADWADHGVFHSMSNVDPVVLPRLSRGEKHAVRVSVADDTFIIGGEATPTLTVYRGTTFSFSVDTLGHPLHLQTRGDGFDPEASYTTGLAGAGIEQGTIFWRVAEDTPAELFYQSEASPRVWGRIIVKDLPADSSLGDGLPTGLSEEPEGTNGL